VFFVIFFEKIIQVASLVGGRAQVEHPARISRRGIRGVGFPGDLGSGRFGPRLDQRAAAHSAEAVVAGVFISAIRAAQVFL
jgi:hypothetical protein